MAKKRAAGGGRKEADHQIRLMEMARLILDDKSFSPQKAARQVAIRVVDLGDAYDWQGQPRIRNPDSLARCLIRQWTRRGRGEAMLAAERADCNARNRSVATWPDPNAQLRAYAEGRSVLSVFSPEQLARFGALSAEQYALALLGDRWPLIPLGAASNQDPVLKAALREQRAAAEIYQGATLEEFCRGVTTPEEISLKRALEALARKISE